MAKVLDKTFLIKERKKRIQGRRFTNNNTSEKELEYIFSLSGHHLEYYLVHLLQNCWKLELEVGHGVKPRGKLEKFGLQCTWKTAAIFNEMNDC